MSRHNDVSWSTAFNAVLDYIDRHVYVEGRDRLISALYAIAQVFYDLVPVFPILRIIGEWGSGKKLLANAIVSASPLYIEVADPSEASLYRLVDAFHPTVIIDETKINEDTALLLNAGFERDKKVTRSRQVEDRFTIDSFSFYGPKIIVSRPGKLDLPIDTISRTIEVHVERYNEQAYPLEIAEEEREEVVSMLILLKVRRWREFLNAYNMLRNTITRVDGRTRDTYLPLITVAYLISRESNDPGIFKAIIEDMLRTAEERAGVDYIQATAIVGILKHITQDSTLTGGVVDVVKVSVKDIAEAMHISEDDHSTKTRIGLFLREAPFKVGVERSGGYTYYAIDIEKLYDYVKRYNVDISALGQAELEELKRRTGLDWAAGGFNKDAWLSELIGRLFPCNNAASSGVETAVEI